MSIERIETILTCAEPDASDEMCAARFVRAKTLAFDKRHELDDPQPFFDAQINAARARDARCHNNSVSITATHKAWFTACRTELNPYAPTEK